MDLSSLTLLSLAEVGLGAAATYLIAQWLPESVIDLAAQHGRYVGLGERAQEATPAAPHRGRTQHEALNVVRTAHS